MLDRITKICLENRLIIIAASLLLLLVGGYVGMRMKVDVFPDLTAPTVTIMTDAHGMAPEEVEALVTYPIETAINGATGVRRVRSSSTFGMSTVYCEFEWGTDIYRARQVVNEKLQLVVAGLPRGILPALAPISSIMGEIMYIGLMSETHTLMEVKETADFVVRKRLLSVPGVSQVVSIGGETKQYQVSIAPPQAQRLRRLSGRGRRSGEGLKRELLSGSHEIRRPGLSHQGGREDQVRRRYRGGGGGLP